MDTERTSLTGKEKKRSRYVASEEADAERWLELAREIGTLQKPVSCKKGSLTIVGTGVKCVSQFTLEALAELKSADDVFYCVGDAVTERFIKRLRPDAMDLYVLYEDEKKRIVSYVQMAEVGLHQARKGRHVCMVFYGHCAVFVLPSHRAMQIARKEGIDTKMLASVSNETCLFADLGIDPSFPGLQTLEATDFLIRNRPINMDFHVVLWQVGCVGDMAFRRKGYSNDNFHILIEKLQDIYGKDYEIIHYMAAQYPITAPKVQRISLLDLLNPAEHKKVTAMSLFYFPPKTVSQLDIDMALLLGIIREDSPAKSLRPGHRVIDAYADKENQFIQNLADWQIPTDYSTPEETELSNILTDLSLNPIFLRHCKEKGYPTLSNKGEDDALNSGHHGRIRSVLKPGNAVRQAQMDILEQEERSDGFTRPRKVIPRKSYIPSHISPIFAFQDCDSDEDCDGIVRVLPTSRLLQSDTLVTPPNSPDTGSDCGTISPLTLQNSDTGNDSMFKFPATPQNSLCTGYGGESMCSVIPKNYMDTGSDVASMSEDG